MLSLLKHLKFKIFFLFLAIIIQSTPAFAALSLENDGSARSSADDCYGQSKQIPATYKDVEYYDCYVPYQLTPKEIGGYCITSSEPDFGGNAPNYLAMDQWKYILDLPVGNHVTAIGGCYGISGVQHTTDHGSQVYEKNGIKYFSIAPGEYFYKNKDNYVEKVNSEPFKGPDYMVGDLCDIVLTSGDIIHFVIFTENASDHSNGPCRKEFWSGTNNMKCKLNYPMYAHIYNGMCGDIIELGGAGTEYFCNKYNLKDKSDVHIAFIRIYKASIKDSGLKVTDEAKNGDYSFHVDVEGGTNAGGSPKDNGAADKANDNANKDNTVDDKFIPEKDLYGIGNLDTLSTTQKEVSLASNEDFNEGQLELVGIQKKDLENNFITTIHFWIRVLVAWVGMILMLYAVLLLLAYLFDRSNNFFSISLVGLMTMGHIKYTDYHDSYDSSSSATLKKVLTSSIILIIVASVLISGSMYVGIRKWLEALMR